MPDLKIGDVIEQRHGPFIASWVVVELIPAGARLRYEGHVAFVGYEGILWAPSGQYLTETTDQGFIGRAHFPAARVTRHG